MMQQRADFRAGALIWAYIESTFHHAAHFCFPSAEPQSSAPFHGNAASSLPTPPLKSERERQNKDKIALSLSFEGRARESNAWKAYGTTLHHHRMK